MQRERCVPLIEVPTCDPSKAEQSPVQCSSSPCVYLEGRCREGRSPSCLFLTLRNSRAIALERGSVFPLGRCTLCVVQLLLLRDQTLNGGSRSDPCCEGHKKRGQAPISPRFSHLFYTAAAVLNVEPQERHGSASEALQVQQGVWGEG